MNVLVQYPSEIRAEVVHPCDHGHLWINDKLDPGNFGSNLVAEDGNKFGDALVLLSTSPSPLDESKAYNQTIEEKCEDVIAFQEEMPFESTQSCFGDDATASSLENMTFNKKSVKGSGETGYTKSNEYDSVSVNPTSTSSALVPAAAAVKIMSSMKGSREIHGLHLKKLSVTWAPDVYDPPVTSRCHSVKRYHQQRYRLHKKIHRRKHKAKTSRSSSNDKKTTTK